ncbi:hypothetical protein SAMN05192558_101413 [Actinokineospora alba]|uniref:Cell wall-active antibiotics response 4TMS YvqF n=1 Tax=Actinokineospora alba TaxID=504798 RepID=A0A1H0FKF3_9PSEU|nr:LiaF domain-containing protein [Actinokineospora alba]SDN95248.1 hypothetical protein SAMN05192558_101413 [Actinokineospora alba]
MKPVRLWIGLVLLVLGTFLALDALDVLDALDAGTTIDWWWPAALSGLGVVAMITRGGSRSARRGHRVGPDPAGRHQRLGRRGPDRARAAHHDRHRCAGQCRAQPHPRPPLPAPVALFGEAKTTDHGEHFEHSTVSAVFGGATLDLRDAHIDRSATVDAFALFSGVDVLVPRGWRVSVGGLPIFGGYEDKTRGNGSLPRTRRCSRSTRPRSSAR